MRTANAWQYLLCVACALVLFSSCQPEKPKPPQTIRAVRESGGIYQVTMARADTPGGQGKWSESAKMVLATPDCTDSPCIPDTIILKADTTGGQID